MRSLQFPSISCCHCCSLECLPLTVLFRLKFCTPTVQYLCKTVKRNDNLVVFDISAVTICNTCSSVTVVRAAVYINIWHLAALLLRILLRSAKWQNKSQAAEEGRMFGWVEEWRKKVTFGSRRMFCKASEEERSNSDSMLLLSCLRYVRNGGVAECIWSACLFLFFVFWL